MPLDNGAAAPVRSKSEIPGQSGGAAVSAKSDYARFSTNGGAAETTKPDFELAFDAALASIDKIMGSRQRAREFARARREILAAADVMMKAEKRQIVAALTPAQLRREVRELLDSHAALLDYIDDLERLCDENFSSFRTGCIIPTRAEETS
jgi:hypothetical protein